MKQVLSIAICLILWNAVAHPQAEELAVAEHLVLMIMSSPEWEDNLDATGIGSTLVPHFDEYKDLFDADFPSNHVGFSWSPAERRTAFENFIAAIPELSTNGQYKAIGSHGGIALEYCRDRGASNVLNSAMRIMTSRHSVAQDSARRVFEEFATPTDPVNRYATQILTNKTAETGRFRRYFMGVYAKVLMAHKSDCLPECFTNGVSNLMVGVDGWAGAIALDKLLMDAYPGYESSSNRLAIAQSALSAGYPIETYWDWASSVREYFTPITNQLLEAFQPLPEVDALRKLPQGAR